MAKEITMYEAKDGTAYKTKKGAENRDKKLAVENKISELNMTKEEIQSKLIECSKYNRKVDMLIKSFGEWPNWRAHLISQIDPKLWDKKNKTTQYIKEKRTWGGVKEEILFTEIGPEFTDTELHTNDDFKLLKVEEVNEILKKVYYVDKYTTEELAVKKLESGERLSEDEISTLLSENDAVYTEEGEMRRWSRSVMSVVEINDKLYAIDWEEGLTENQENEFFEQPYEVELGKREVVTIQTFVTRKVLWWNIMLYITI